MSTPAVTTALCPTYSNQDIGASASSHHSNPQTIGVSSKPIQPNLLLKKTAFVCGVVCIASLTIAAIVGTMGVGLLPVAALLGALAAGSFLGGCVSWAEYIASTKSDVDEHDFGNSNLEDYGRDVSALSAGMAAMNNAETFDNDSH